MISTFIVQQKTENGKIMPDISENVEIMEAYPMGTKMFVRVKNDEHVEAMKANEDYTFIEDIEEEEGDV